MMETKTFPLATVLSIAGDRLLVSFDGIYDILNWMTNDDLFMHQLPRACRETRPWLKRWFPEVSVAEPNVDRLVANAADSGGDVPAAIERALQIARTEYGCRDTYDVPRIPRDDHDYKNPLVEAAEILGRDRVIAVQL